MKSATLALLVEQMGLADPERYIFAARHWDPIFLTLPNALEAFWPTGTIPELILERNFDPETLLPSHWVNGTLFAGMIIFDGVEWWVWSYPVDPGNNDTTPVTSGYPDSGYYRTGLTRDDVGGLRYLLASNTIRFETLLPDVHGAGTNGGAFINGAPRPGVEKVTFVRQPLDGVTGQPVPLTNTYTDTFLSNGIIVHQQLERVVSKPDLLFGAADVGDGNGLYLRTDTTHWANNAAMNGNATGAGPGVIGPPVTIVFHTAGVRAFTDDSPPGGATSFYDCHWASYDGSTNRPVIYPYEGSTNRADMTFHFRLLAATRLNPADPQFTWRLHVPLSGVVLLQASTNLVDWVSLASVTNTGTTAVWQHRWARPQRFFRIVPE